MKSSDDPEEHTLLKEAINFLSEQLAHFHKAVSKLKKESNDYGLSWRTTLRAKTALTIVTKKSGMDGGWIWSLPKETKASEECHTKTLASFGEFGLLRQDLNNLESKNEIIGQNLSKRANDHEEYQTKIVIPFENLGLLRQDLNDFKENNNVIGQNLLKEAKLSEGGQSFCMAPFDKEDGHLQQNLTNSEKPKEEYAFFIDVSDLPAGEER